MKKAANEVDRHVGQRVRMRRMMMGMSQEKLGDALGLTFQQVQKYEKGTNRISASRLRHISEILGVTIDFLYQGADGAEANDGRPAPDNEMLSSDALKLVRAFNRITDLKVRRRLIDLTTALSEPAAGEERLERSA